MTQEIIRPAELSRYRQQARTVGRAMTLQILTEKDPDLAAWAADHPQAYEAVIRVVSCLHTRSTPRQLEDRYRSLADLSMRVGESATVAAFGMP